MKLYDFCAYSRKRDAILKEKAAVDAVVKVITHIDQPGSVKTLKANVDGWFSLHRDVNQLLVNSRS